MRSNVLGVMLLLFSLGTQIKLQADEHAHQPGVFNQSLKWDEALSTQSYSIFTAVVPGSKFDAIKAEVELPADLETVKQRLGSEYQCWEWINRCKSTVLVNAENLSNPVVYTIVDMPWPFSDRAFMFTNDVIESQTSDGRTQVELVFVPSSYEYTGEMDAVRGRSTAYYHLVSGSNKSDPVVLTILMHTDFGGRISPTLINAKLADELQKDIITLLKMTQRNTPATALP